MKLCAHPGLHSWPRQRRLPRTVRGPAHPAVHRSSPCTGRTPAGRATA